MKQFLFRVFIALLLFGCKPGIQEADVKFSGALRTMMSGNLEATVSLDSLSKRPNLYALGALENLKGEVQIFDSETLNSTVEFDNIVLDTTFDKKAALIVYAQVANWQNVDIPNEINSSVKLEKFIEEQSKKLGIDTEKPFPFLIEGNVKSLNWHIIDWKDGDTVHTHQKHKESGLNGILENEKVEIIGFYSKEHKAVFTHHTTFVHMHFKTEDAVLAGHIDSLELGTKMQLKLPKT